MVEAVSIGRIVQERASVQANSQVNYCSHSNKFKQNVPVDADQLTNYITVKALEINDNTICFTDIERPKLQVGSRDLGL